MRFWDPNGTAKILVSPTVDRGDFNPPMGVGIWGRKGTSFFTERFLATRGHESEKRFFKRF